MREFEEIDKNKWGREKKLTIFSRGVFLWRDRLFKASKELSVLFPVEQTYKRKTYLEIRKPALQALNLKAVFPELKTLSGND